MRCVPKDLLARFSNKQVFQVFYVQITKDTTVEQNFVHIVRDFSSIPLIK